jgi:hypothetical protein
MDLRLVSEGEAQQMAGDDVLQLCQRRLVARAKSCWVESGRDWERLGAA